MSTDPVRFLDDPAIAAELREVILSQAKPDALPASQRYLVHQRIAASVLALPVSLKLGALASHGSATTGAAASGSAASGAVASSGAAASSGAVSGSVAVASAQTGGVAVGSVVASTSVAPVAATGGVLAGGGMTVAGAKGALAGVAGAVSMTKGAAVLGVALATGAGATYVTQETSPERGAAVSVEQASTSARADAPLRRTSERKSAVRVGQADHTSDEAAQARGAAGTDSQASREGRAGKVGALGHGHEGAGAVSLSELEDIRHGSGAVGRSVPVEKSSAAQISQSAPSSEQLQQEVALLRRAQQLLRTDRVLAARVLDQYDAEFPQGAMRAEYDVLRRRSEQSLAR